MAQSQSSTWKHTETPRVQTRRRHMSQQDGDTWKSTEAEHVTGQVATCGETQWGHVDMCDDATCQNLAVTCGHTI